MRQSVRVVILALCAVAGFAAGAAGQQKSYRVCRAENPPRIDGKFDDDCWAQAPWEAGFIPRVPNAPTPQTQFCATWDNTYLYIAVRALEPRMRDLKRTAPDGAKEVLQDDHVEAAFMRTNDRSWALQMALGANGSRVKNLFGNQKQTPFGAEREGKWLSVCADSAAWWSAEMAVPLADLGIEAREGAVIAASVVRARCAGGGGEADVSAWPQFAAPFNDPTRLGSFTLGGGPLPGDAGSSLAQSPMNDVVTTVRGDRLTGRILDINEAGEAHIASASMQDAAVLRRGAIRQIQFGAPATRSAPAQVALVNGDWFQGRVTERRADATVVESASSGRIAVPNAAISSISFPGRRAGDIDPLLDCANIAPWRLASGTALPAADGMAFSNQARLSVGVRMKNAMTIVFSGRTNGGAPILYGMDIQASGGQPADRATFNLSINQNQCSFTQSSPNYSPPRTQSVQPVTQGESNFRLAFDTDKGTVVAWLNGQLIEEGKVAGTLPENRTISIYLQTAVIVKRLAVLPGVVPPEKDDEASPAAACRMRTVGGEFIAADAATFANGQWVARTAGGERRVGADEIAWIRFRRETNGPRADGKARITADTEEGIFTLKSCVLTAESLTGESILLGKLSLDRVTLRSLTFDPVP